jgi:ABC-type glycerol-3-phosphate transport system substrate-binding protein
VIKAAVLATAGVWTAAAQAQETVVWWDFLGGGDGVRMKKLIEDFNAEHAGARFIAATCGATSSCIAIIAGTTSSTSTIPKPSP